MPEPTGEQPLSAELTEALADLRAVLEPCGDVVFRPFALGTDRPAQAAAVYCKSLVDSKDLDDHVLAALMVQITEAAKARTLNEAVGEILAGFVAILVDGREGALLVDMKSRSFRVIDEPPTEGAVRGPREGFIENLETNLTLIRRRLPVPEFRVELQRIGRRTRTAVAIAYLEGLAQSSVVEEVRQRLGRIRIDGVMDAAYIEELIEDHPRSPFPTIENTERPDKVAAALLEGRVAILAANTPTVLIVPVCLAQFLQASEDYYERYYLAAILRPIRAMACFLTLTLPGFYVAVTTYHHEMIPAALFISLAAQREGVPWPAVVEALLMEVTFELLREAGIRLPRPVGQAISIIGGVVIGEAAVRARIASAGMVIVVATTGIASFALPAYSFAVTLRLLRFLMIVAGATLGLAGLLAGLLVTYIHMVSLRSFGVHYMYPVTPAVPGDWKDLLVRAPRWSMRRRPASVQAGERMPPGQMPGKDRP